MGRPAKHEPWLTEDGLLRIEGWARDGLTTEKIAGRMGVAPASLYSWQKKHPQIAEALRKGRAPVDVKIELAMIDSAMGYVRKVKKPMKIRQEITRNGEGKTVVEHIEYVDEEIFVPANPMAQILWLKNRRPDIWNNKASVQSTDDDPLERLLNRLDAEAQEGAAP